MKQIFRPGANLFALVSAIIGLYVVAGGIWVLIVLDRSHYTRRVNLPVEQPVAFSHELHAGSLGMDCRYCHTSVAIAASANIPPTETCITCHHEVKANSALLQPVWQSLNTNTPIEWVRVHDLPDHVYFNHGVHVTNGIGCTECHGQVDEMPVVWRVQNLTMGWCLDCHRNPEEYIRPRAEVWNQQYEHPADQLALGAQLVEEYGIVKSELANCTICHR